MIRSLCCDVEVERETQSHTYNLNADILRIAAIFAVVGIHTLTAIYARPDFFGGKFWWISFLLNCIFRTSVPLFVMLSGYFVLAKTTTIATTLSRAVKRIGIPLVAFYLLTHLVAFISGLLRHEYYDPWSLLDNLNKNTHTYLYFLVVLFFLYLLTPFFQLIFTAKNKQLPRYIIGFFLVNAALATLARYLSLRTGEPLHTYTLWIVWVGYYLYGYFFRLQQENKTVKLGREWLWLLIGYGITAVFGYISLAMHIHGNDLWYIGGQTFPEEYLSVNVMLMSIALFRMMMTMKLPTALSQPKAVTLIRTVAQLSFGIYLVHPIVMDILNKFCGITADSPWMPNLVIYVVINAALTLIISTILAAGLYFTPGLKRLVGQTARS